LSTVKLCVTGVAGTYVVFPDCDAVMLQAPLVKKVAVLLETVQANGVLEVDTTARLELAVASNVSCVPRDWGGMVLKVMVCDVRATPEPDRAMLCVAAMAFSGLSVRTAEPESKLVALA
jgi:hypothetical protein